MSANIVLASICLALVVVLTMVVTAVAAYFLWSGAMWWVESTKEAERGDDHGLGGLLGGMGMSSSRLPSRQRPFDVTVPGASMQEPFGAGFDPSGADFSQLRPGMPAAGHGLNWRGSRTAAQSNMFFSMGGSPGSSAVSPQVHIGGRAGRRQQSPAISEVPSSPETAEPRPEELKRGYAAHLSMKFGGNLDFHSENVSAIADIYDLSSEDICYCFLCFEEVSAESNADLSLKKWGTGPYSARIWTVTLARFVKAAQKHRTALDEAPIEELCTQWQYKHEHFLQELTPCEALFQRKYGRRLLQAFQQAGVHGPELARAMRMLSEHGVSAAPRSKRLALAEAPAQTGQKKSRPALTLPATSEVRLSRANSMPELEDDDGKHQAKLALKRRATTSELPVPAKRSKPLRS